MFVHHLKSVVIMVVGVLFLASGIRAEEIHVIATGAVSGAFKQIVPQFESQSGYKLSISWGPSSGKSPEAIPVRLKNGEPADVVIMIGANMDKLLSDGLFAAQTRIDFAKTGIGVGVKVGQTPPDISTVAALRQALLNAKSIGYSEGASGTYISTDLLKNLGVADQVAAKSKVIVRGRMVGEAIANSEVELGLQQISELRLTPGVIYVGPLPDEVQQINLITAAISAKAERVEAAKRFLKYLSSTAAAEAVTKSGLDPVAPVAASEKQAERR